MNLPPPFEETAKLIEEVLRDMGLDPEKDRVDPIKNGYASWLFYSSSSAIYVDLYSEKDWKYVSVISPIFTLPDGDPSPLYRRLLELNHGLYGCAYTVNQNSVFVGLRRETEDLTNSELRYTLNRVSYYADEAARTIAKEFNCPLHLKK